MHLSLAFVVVAAGVDLAAAHGYLASATMNGVTYPGWAPFSDLYVISISFLNNNTQRNVLVIKPQFLCKVSGFY